MLFFIEKLTNARFHTYSCFAPFDGIIITAAAPVVPEALIRQLAEGGTLVVPEGDRDQMLRVYRKQEGKLMSENLEAVRFVPLLAGIER